MIKKWAALRVTEVAGKSVLMQHIQIYTPALLNSQFLLGDWFILTLIPAAIRITHLS